MAVPEIVLALLAAAAVGGAVGAKVCALRGRERRDQAPAPVAAAPAADTDADALDRAHALLDAIYASAPVGLGFWDRQLRFVRVNDRLAGINGLPPHAHLGRTPLELLPGISELEQLMAQWRRILSGELSDLHIEVSGETPAAPGETRYWRERFFPVRVGGEIVGVGGVVEDITERKRVEAGLRESEERFRWIVQRAPIPVFVHALDGEILAMSRTVTEQTGWTQDDLPDVRAWYALGRRVPPEQLDALLAENHRRFAANEPVEPEVMVWTKQGEPRKWLFHRSEIKRQADGRPFLTSMAIDITERGKAEAALRDADRRKDEFLAMLAHELRNPLAPIRNAVQLLKTHDAAVDPAALTQMLERQLSHLVRLVDDLLDVSRVTRGKIELKRETTDLRQVVAHAIEVVQPQFDDRRQTLEVRTPPQVAAVRADATRLIQVVLNLLANASKFSPEGSHVVLAVERAGEEWTVRVSDRGQGIAPELLPRVFDLFIQGERSLDRTEGGLGIGLSLVKALVELHGGRVEARSAGAGQGSEFEVRLPVAVSTAPLAAQAPVPASAAGQRRRVLAVDDNRDSAESLCMLLQLWGHEARCAFDGRQALDVVEAFEPDVVLLDIGLPGMSGYDLAARMRERPTLREVTLIAVTGYGQEEDRRRVRAAGFDHHLVKPVDPDTLERLMNTLQRPAA